MIDFSEFLPVQASHYTIIMTEVPLNDSRRIQLFTSGRVSKILETKKKRFSLIFSKITEKNNLDIADLMKIHFDKDSMFNIE